VEQARPPLKPPSTVRFSQPLSLALLALLFTLLNALKPLQVDDAAYYYFANQIAHSPGDPYGFELFWYQQPQPANHVLAPPVLPAWWAIAIHLFGDRPFLWKMWLLPFSVLFVYALAALGRRFARGMEMPLVVMTVLAPTFLPSLNLMLDVPALALALISIVLFLKAWNRDSVVWAVSAGLCAGVATQTKYTALLAPAVMVMYTIIFGAASWRRGLWRSRHCGIAIALAGLVFLSWEAWVAARYGESHFLHEYRSSDAELVDQLWLWTYPLFVLLGGLASITALVGLAALGWGQWKVATAGGVIAVGFALVALFTGQITLRLHPLPALGEWTWEQRRSVEEVVFGALGAGVALVALAVCWRLVRVGRGGLWRPSRWRRQRADWFLVAWLAMEVAGYFALTPFGAVRRVMGIIVVGSLLFARLASRTCRRQERLRLVWGVALANAVLGLAFYALDFRDAWVIRCAAENAARFVRERDPRARIWYVGHWGFQFYAERAGFRPVVPGDEQCVLHAGDWLVVPDPIVNQQRIVIDPKRAERIADAVLADAVPLRIVPCFYGTATGAPVEHDDGPRMTVAIYQVRADWVPAAPE
jgi:hypothetical protein